MEIIRKNETKTDFDLLEYIKKNKQYSNTWELRKTTNKHIQKILDKSSKKKTGSKGYPDLIYVNENKKLLILTENKPNIKDHISRDGNNPIKYAVDGIKHYLTFFFNKNINTENNCTQRYLENWKIIGIAFSGDINDKYNHRLDTFIIKNDNISNINESGILDEDDYIAYFENIDLEKIATDVSKSSKEINNLIRNLDSQKRPVLLSALMICLYPNDDISDFRNNYQSWQTQTIIRNIPTTVSDVLKEEGIDESKIDVLTNELSFINTDKDLTTTDILKDILKELENNVIPLFSKKTAYDIIGKFYEEFLRYAGVANVKKGIVLTPSHITKLFCELIDIKTDDVIFDPACGSGAFLIAGMNRLIDIIGNSNLPNKKSKIANIKTKQLIGIEKSTTMYTLAISNMLFRGDGKSQIFNEDFFTTDADNILNNLENKPTIGLINPPFGGKDNKKNPTKKEIQFLEKLLDTCSRYVIIIAPLSAYFTDDVIRNRILKKHKLKYVINMPNELFQPNASSHTAISVFETNISHTESDKVIFYYLKDDGFVLSKNKGRTDPLNKWNKIKKDFLNKIRNPIQYEDKIDLVYKSVTSKDEWIIQAHSKTDYSQLSKEDFLKTIREYVVFNVKKELNLLGKDIDELKIIEILKDNQIRADSVLGINNVNTLNITKWNEYKISDLFEIEKGERLIEVDRIAGDIPLITASSYNNGITSNISFDVFENRKKLFKNRISVDMFANVFYHSYNYFSDDNIHTLSLKSSQRLNVYSSLFLVSIIKKLQSRYGFGRQVRLHRLEKEIIKLPSKQNIKGKNEPDWQFMENYVKSLSYSINL